MLTSIGYAEKRRRLHPYCNQDNSKSVGVSCRYFGRYAESQAANIGFLGFGDKYQASFEGNAPASSARNFF